MSASREWLRELLQIADARALPALYAAVSVSSVRTREWLRERELPFLDPDGPRVRLEDADHTADHVITQSCANAAAIGAFTGVVGWLGVPPEVAAWTVSTLRMAQRLAVVYGFDPSTDRGHAALSRAVAAGFQVDVPRGGVVELRLSDLPGMVGVTTPDVRQVGTGLVRAVVWRSARLATGRVGRLLPVVASGVSAVGNHQEAAAVGDRMKAVFRQLAEAPAPPEARVFEAIELEPQDA